MPTFLNVKNAVAENLGRTDGATFNTKREGAINRARRKFYSEKPWSFLAKVAATPTFTNNLATLPTDYNQKFDPICVYYYNGNLKYQFDKADWSELQAYTSTAYKYALDQVNNTIKLSQTPGTILLDYIYLPADYTAIDGSQDTTVEPAPDTIAIELLATAYFFMSSRQSKGSYQQFLDGYREEVAKMAADDIVGTVPRFFHLNPYIYPNNQGYRTLH